MLPPIEGQEAKTEAPAQPIFMKCSECGKKLSVKAAFAGKHIKCPMCDCLLPVPPTRKTGPPPLTEVEPETAPLAEPAPARAPKKRISILAVIVLVTAIFGCSIYANLSFAVNNPVNYKYFPPFKPYQNNNHNMHLGAEYFSIARAMVAGEGFANPFNEPTGPTAWMPPVLPTILAGILWLCDGNRDVVMAVYIFLQVYTLIGTGLLVMALARRTTGLLGSWVTAIVFFLVVIGDFRLWFQFTHDYWLVLLAVDLLLIGLCWFEPLSSKKAAAAWGVAGGMFAMINPIVALCWGVLTVALGCRQRAWSRLALALLVSALALAPWTVRNYLIFGRLIPVKSNLTYELYQSQCLIPDGLLRPDAFGRHPWVSAGRERQIYKEIGEMAFVDQKRDLFWKSVSADPLDFADRVASRFLGATLWYVPFNRQELRQPWLLWPARLTHPLPFLSLLVLVFTGVWQRLHWYQWTVMGVYMLYLLPYVGVSYYERYAMPLLGVKVLLVIWAADRVLTILFAPRQSADEEFVLASEAR